MISSFKLNKLSKIALEIRKKILINSFFASAHHIGSELSCVEILTSLYFNEMKINKKNINDSNRDWFILSKGHAALVQYIVLEMKGLVKKDFVKKNFLINGKKLGGHPDFKSMPGIEVSSGSLGNGLSIGAGVALYKKIEKKAGRVFVLLGDGECNQGQIWEALMFATHHKLNKLVIIIDSNKLQGLGKTKEIMGSIDYKKIFKNFGADYYEVDGHNIEKLCNILKKTKSKKNTSVILANTIKGKGIKNYEGKIESHYFSIKDQNTLKIMLKNLK